MFYFTNDQIDEIEKRLAVRAKKDTDFDAVSEAQEGDLVAIIHNGRNMICRLDKLPGRLVAKRYDEIPAEITEENILETPTAFSISVLKTLLGIEEMPEFDDDTAYEKGSYVSYTDANGILRGYVFTADKPAGYWDESKVTEINYASLSENIKDILSEFKSGGRVYVLESYFTNGKAKKAIADEDGKNIKQYYALKTDIPDVNREIAEAIAVKLDNTPKGSHEVPIYIALDLQTGYGKSEVIDSLHLPGDIRSDLDIFAGRGVAAYGIADLSLSGRGGSGTLTEIQIDGTTIPDINGVVNLPAYPSALSQLTSDTTHRLVTDSQISYWTEKYDLPTGGIPKTDLSSSVQDTLDTADSSAVTLSNLIAGLTSKGAHNLPIYFDSNTDVQEIDSLLVPGNIQSTNGGVSALGIADLSVSSGAGRGTITEIQINSVPYPDVNGIVNLPAYPSTLSELTADSTHRVVTDSQITSWTAKYDLPSGGIPKTDLSSAVQTSLGKADNALEKFSLGAHNLPIWFNSSKEPQIIDSLSVSGDIESTAGGVSANGIASLAISSGSQGTLTQIKIGDTPYPDVNGVVTLPEYPTAASLISDGLASRDWVSENYAAKSYEGRVQTIESYIPTQATSSNKLADKNFVNSSIATATATFKGTVTAVGDSEAQAQTALATITGMDANDYAFVKVENTPQVGVDKFKRYKYTGSVWSYEYTLNNSSFTSDQWAAINSGLTSTGATTITTLGTITTGEWQGTAIADSYISSAGTWNNAVTTLINLKSGLTSKGAHDLPVYLNSSAQAVAIDALSVPGNIQSTAGGVSAQGIADLSVSGGSAGTLTLIYVGDTPYPDVNGVVTLPAYPSTLDEISDGSSRKLSDYTKTTAFQTLAVKGGTTSVGSYSPISGLELSILAGSNITVTPDATNHTITIANTYSYSLPTASSGTKGGIKVGSTLDISNEVLNQKAGIVTAGTYKSVTVDTYGRVTAGTNPTTLSDFGITDGVNGLQKSGSGYLSDVDFVEGNDHSLLFTFTSFAKAQIGHTGGSGTTTYKMRVKADGAWSDYLALQQAGASAWGIVTDQSQTFGGDKTFNGNIHGMQGVSAKGIATLELGGGGGSGTVTSIKFGSASVIAADNGLLSVPVGQGTSNGQIKIGGQDISVKGLAALAYLPSLAFSDLTTHPTTLGEYGINDAKIANGVITLGSNSITPLTGITSSMVTTALGYTPFNNASFTQANIQSTLGISNWALASSKPSYAFSEITGTASESQIPTLAISKISGLQTALDNKLATSLKGAANGLAELDANGLVPSSQLPSYVDDVLEYASKSAFPSTGTSGKIYVALDTNLTYRWSGTAYVEISPSLALGETSSTAYRGDRGKTAYDHATETKSGAQNSGFYKFSVTAQGHISGVSAVTASDLTTLIGSTTYAPYNANGYLPLSGGTMANTNLVTNLNADLLDGKHSSDFVSALGTSGDYLTWTKTGGSANNIIVPYASLATDTRVENLTNQTITYRQTAGGGLTYKPSAAVVKRVLGNSVVWNQRIYDSNYYTTGSLSCHNCTASYSNGIATITGSSGDSSFILDNNGTAAIVGHKYYHCIVYKSNKAVNLCESGSSGAFGSLATSSIFTKYSDIATNNYATASKGFGFFLYNASAAWEFQLKMAVSIDLTLFFNGNIPTGLTAETFERDYGYLLANPEYNAGTIINNAAKGLESTGFNLWDKSSLSRGYYNCTNGEFNDVAGQGGRYYLSDFIPVKAGETYYFSAGLGAGSSGSIGVAYFDGNKTWTSGSYVPEGETSSFTKTIPSGVSYMRLSSYDTYVESVNFNCCINLSDTTKNGQYEPYKKNVLPLNLNSFRVKDAQGNIVTINGLKKAGSVYDEIVGKKFIHRVGSVDLGSLTWWKHSDDRYAVTLAGTSLNAKKATGASVLANCLNEHYDNITANNFSDKTKLGVGISFDGYIIAYITGYSTASDFKNAMSGVYMNFELDTYVEYEIVDDFLTSYPIDVLGTERIVSDELVAPFVADIQYGAEQRNIAYDINNLHISAGLLSNRASALESYFTDGIANNAARLSNTSAIGSTTKPVYFTANGVPSACSDYAGGTAVTLNGSSKAASTASFYAPTGAGTSGQILKSTAGTPEWINQSALVAGKATQLETSRSLWGQSFNGTADIGTDKFAKMPYLLFMTVTSGSDATIGYVGRDASNNVIHLTSYSGVPVSIGAGQQDDIYITTGHNVGIGGITSPSEKLHVAGNILSSGNIVANGGVAARGMATLQGGAGTGNPVTQINIGSTPYTPSSGVVSLPAYPTWSTLSGKPSNVSAFTNDSGYIDSSALAVTFTTTTLTSSSTSVYLNNTVQRDTLQKITISSASYGGQTFTLKLTGSGSYYGYHRQVLVMNNSGKNINLSLTDANYIYIGTYEWLTSGGYQHSTSNPIPFDYDMNTMFLLDIIQASSSEYPVVKVTRMGTYVD